GIEAHQIALLELHEAARVRRIGIGTEDRTAMHEKIDLVVSAQDKRRIVTGIRVDEDPARLQLAIEQRHELRRQPSAMDDVIELLQRADDFEIAVGGY